MFGRKETPQEYEQRKARQAAEKAQRQRDYEARQARREQKHREWEQKEREFARNRSAKQNLVSQMRSLANQLNADNVKQSCAKRKSLWSSFKNAGYAGKEYNKPLGSEMKSASDAFQRQLESIFQKREVKYRQAKAAKELLVAEAQRLASSTDWKGGKAKAQDMMARWKKAGYAGKDVDQRLWTSFQAARSSFFERRQKHYDELFKSFEKNAAAKRSLISQQSRLTSTVGASSDFKLVRSQMAELMSQWKRTGSAGNKNDALWSEFNNSRQSCFSKIKEEERKAWEKREAKRQERKREKEARRDKYATGQEIARDRHGNVIGRYSKGKDTKIHETSTSYGDGKTTLHPDGNSHHHGDHAHVLGGKKEESFTQPDGTPSKKPGKPKKDE